MFKITQWHSSIDHICRPISFPCYYVCIYCVNLAIWLLYINKLTELFILYHIWHAARHWPKTSNFSHPLYLTTLAKTADHILPKFLVRDTKIMRWVHNKKVWRHISQTGIVRVTAGHTNGQTQRQNDHST